MGLERRQRGRPRKAGDTIPLWKFAREGAAMWAYDEARGSGEKHSAAVAQAADFVKKLYPGIRISETEVRRILAMRRPRNAGTILRFERSIMTEEQGPSNDDQAHGTTVFKIRFAERPTYPRHNRKNPKE